MESEPKPEKGASEELAGEASEGREGFYPNSKSFVGASSRPNFIIKISKKRQQALLE
jgi:hypothetical protein